MIHVFGQPIAKFRTRRNRWVKINLGILQMIETPPEDQEE